MAGYIGSKASVTQVDGYNKAEGDTRYVEIAGDTMTGALLGTDLTLSGGVYLGGTGSSNKLDDYEEGSFTPQLDTTNLVGYYTKIGNLCYFTIWGTDTNDSDNDITGLPFTASNRNYAGVITFGRSRGVDWYDPNGVPCRAYVNNGSTSITFRTNRVSGDDASFTITTNAISDWSISGVYQTT